MRGIHEVKNAQKLYGGYHAYQMYMQGMVALSELKCLDYKCYPSEVKEKKRTKFQFQKAIITKITSKGFQCPEKNENTEVEAGNFKILSKRSDSYPIENYIIPGGKRILHSSRV